MLTSEYQSVTIIPEQIQDQDNLKEQDKQTSRKSKTANINLISLNNEIIPFYKYYEDADIVSIYFIKPTFGYINHSEEAVNNTVLISYDNEDRIVSVDIFTASKTLSCHLLDTQSEVDDKPPLLLHSTYHEINDELRLYFNNSISTNITFFKSEEEDIKVAMDDSKRVTALLFCNSSKKICRDS
uniref:Uncharacterized protein n=1 Tax=Rhizophagus irregularis (strain DAOM 181602 / DAOM 197198 / MUCL 43194) TaxID=747089 RepID=U9TWZ6_RHIID